MRTRSSVSARPLIVVLALPLALLVAACGGGETTEAEFVEHGLEFTKIAKTDEDKAMYRRIYECMWPEIRKDQDLLDAFMSADTATAEISSAISALMGPCITGPVGTPEDNVETGAPTGG